MRDEQGERQDDFDLGAQLLPGTTEEAIARLVESNPERHSTSVAARIERARRIAQDGDMSGWEAFYEGRIREIGGDPDEMMPGNKPRYTVEDNGDVKDHQEGVTHSGNAHQEGDRQGGEEHEEKRDPPGDSGVEKVLDGVAVVGSRENAPSAGKDDMGAVARSADIGDAERSEGGGDSAAQDHTETSGPPQGGAPLSEPTGGREHQNVPSQGAAGTPEAVEPCADENHEYPQNVEEQTPCAKCGMKFLEWVMS